jgi:hypothetical protein
VSGGACIAPCASTADCALDFPGLAYVCNANTGYCVPCNGDQDCTTPQPTLTPTCILLGDAGFPGTSPALLTGGGVCGCDEISQCNAGYTCVSGGLAGVCAPPCTYAGGLDSCLLSDFLFGNCPQYITPYCNTFTGVCQQCLDDYDCIGMGCGVSQCDAGMCM